MSRPGITVNPQALRARVTALEHTLEGRIREAVDEVREAVKETAVETAQALARRTFPNAFGFRLAKAQMLFELRTLYATGGAVYAALDKAGEKPLAKKFYAAYKSGDLTQAGSILRRSTTSWSTIPVGDLDPSLHDKARAAKTGQITVSRPWQIVPEADLKFYSELAIKRLGKTASGWSSCAEQLGGNGNSPKWKGTSLHGPGGGSVSEERGEFGLTIVLTNNRPLAKKHLSPGQKAAILRESRRKLADRLIKGPIEKIKRTRKKAGERLAHGRRP